MSEQLESSTTVRDWINDRTGYRGVLHALLLLNFPVTRGARWRYVWGGSLALMLVVEVVTGTLLMTVYSPSEASAWGSVQYLETSVQWGWFVRGVHHYTSHMMLVAILVHMLLVVLTAGYRKPKEFTYWSGLVLGGIVLALAISGNPLPWDQDGYWAYQIETGIAGTMPIIGSSLRTLLVGAGELGNLSLTRLYTLHVAVLPVFAVLLLVIHVALMRREKLQIEQAGQLQIVSDKSSSAEGACEQTEPYWPYQTTRNLGMFAVLMVIVVVQVIYYPKMKEDLVAPASSDWQPDLPIAEISLEAPADRDMPYVARPQWYVRSLFELRHMVDKKNEVFVTAVLPMGVVVLLFLMPFYEKLLGRSLGYAVANLLFIAGLSGMLLLTYTGVSRDQRDDAYRQVRRREIDYAGRAAWLANRNGIPPEGPGTLLRNDAKAMGPLLFAANCAGCHQWNGHDGTGNVVTETVDGKQVEVVPTAPDLYRFASARWIREFLANPRDGKFFGHTDLLKGGDELKDGEMAMWAEENVAPDGPLEPNHLAAVAALVAREANRRDEDPIAEDVLQLGIDVFSGAELSDSNGEPLEFDGNCLQCHDLKAGDPNEEGDGYAPNLNGYGSRDWLLEFIRSPDEERFYGEKNIMPGFDETELSDRELGLLVDWMRGTWEQATPTN